MRSAGFRKRREALGLPPGDTDPFFDTLPLGWEKQCSLGKEAYGQEAAEPPELMAARQRLAACRAVAGAEGQRAEEELPPLSEADMQAILEDSYGLRKELVAEEAARSATAIASPQAENCMPDSSGSSAWALEPEVCLPPSCALPVLDGDRSGDEVAVQPESHMNALD